VPEEPGAGLEHVRMMPPEERDPVPSGAGTSPGALHDSGPTLASIARDSRRSITVRSAEARGGFLVFRRFTGLLLGRPLRRGHIPLLGVQCRKSFQFRKGIGLGGGFRCAAEGTRIRVASLGKGSSPDEGARRRGSGLPNGDEDWRSNNRALPDRSSPSQAHAPEARTIASTPARIAAGNRPHAATTSARSGGTALDFAFVPSGVPGNPRENQVHSPPLPATVGGRHPGREGRRQG